MQFERIYISIHALLAESDKKFGFCDLEPIRFLSTLSLRRATMAFYMDCLKSTYFYPRSPCGERHVSTHHSYVRKYFYPRSPCGERPRTGLTCGGGRNISIHALLAESDLDNTPIKAYNIIFLSTLSLRRATRNGVRSWIYLLYFYPRSPCGERPFEKFEGVIATKISIHALLAESDWRK